MKLAVPRLSNACEIHRGMRIPQFVLSLGILASGVFGGLGLRFVKPVLRWMGLYMLPVLDLQGIYQRLSVIILLMLLIFLLLYLIRRITVKTVKSATWGCGYQKPAARMQYSSLAFVHPLSYFLKPFILLKKSGTSAKSMHPKEISYHEEALDPSFRYIVEPLSKAWPGSTPSFHTSIMAGQMLTSPGVWYS
ncbi:MAG: hypothetical protein LRZ88_10385 [Candidatus Cloacimonetes bacterium]|nr:hypothetical protein [Candidatus Cloacimonadota bacterium]